MGLVYVPTFTIKNQPDLGTVYTLYTPYMDPMGMFVCMVFDLEFIVSEMFSTKSFFLTVL